MKSTFYLFCMLLCYFFPIYCVYSRYKQDVKSVSFLIGQEQKIILFSMFVMEIFTLFYECSDKTSFVSLVCIYFLYLGLYGLICIPESYSFHYIFAGIAFLAILIYMSYVSFYLQKSFFLRILLSIQYFMVICIFLFFYDSWFFLFEVGYIVTFACFYLVYHFLS